MTKAIATPVSVSEETRESLRNIFKSFYFKPDNFYFDAQYLADIDALQRAAAQQANNTLDDFFASLPVEKCGHSGTVLDE